MKHIKSLCLQISLWHNKHTHTYTITLVVTYTLIYWLYRHYTHTYTSITNINVYKPNNHTKIYITTNSHTHIYQKPIHHSTQFNIYRNQHNKKTQYCVWDHQCLLDLETIILTDASCVTFSLYIAVILFNHKHRNCYLTQHTKSSLDHHHTDWGDHQHDNHNRKLFTSLKRYTLHIQPPPPSPISTHIHTYSSSAEIYADK